MRDDAYFLPAGRVSQSRALVGASILIPPARMLTGFSKRRALGGHCVGRRRGLLNLPGTLLGTLRGRAATLVVQG